MFAKKKREDGEAAAEASSPDNPYGPTEELRKAAEEAADLLEKYRGQGAAARLRAALKEVS